MPVVDGSNAGAAVAVQPLRIGVLGCADIALRRFLPAVARSKLVCPVAIASRNRQQAVEIAESFDCAAVSYDELLESKQVDLVYIPLPNHLHEKWVIKALDHGKHVLCEKPLGLSADSVRRMLEAANRNGLLLYENIMYLQHPQHAAIRQMLSSGQIGTVSALHCVFTIPGPAPGNIRLDSQLGGGAFHDMNRYPISAASYFLKGEIAEIVRCKTCWNDGILMSMETKTITTAGERFTFFIAFGQPYRCFYEIRGTCATLRLERAFTAPADHQCRLELSHHGAKKTLLLEAHDHFLLTAEHVARLISSGGNFSAEHTNLLSMATISDRFLQLTLAQKGKS